MVAALSAHLAQRALVFDRLRRHHLPDTAAQPALGDARQLQQLALHGRVAGGEVRSGLQGRVAQSQRVAAERDDALGRLGRRLALQPKRQLALTPRRRSARQGALFGLDAVAELGEQRIVGVEHQRPLRRIRPGMRIDPRGARDHLLQPRPAADLRQRGDDGDLRRIQALIRHRDRDQDRGLGPQAETGQRFAGVALVAGGQAHVVLLRARHPGTDGVLITPGRHLVRRHDQQLAEPPALAALCPAARPQAAGRVERLAQQFVGKPGPQRREQRRPRRLRGPMAKEPVRPHLSGRAVGLLDLRVEPARLAVHGAEHHRQHGALGQRLGAAVADDGPA